MPPKKSKDSKLAKKIKDISRRQAIKSAESQFSQQTVTDTAIDTTWTELPGSDLLFKLVQGTAFGQRDGNEVLMSGVKLELTLDNENSDGYNTFRIIGVLTQENYITDTAAHPAGVHGNMPSGFAGKYKVFYDRKFMLSGTGGQTAKFVNHWIPLRRKLNWVGAGTSSPNGVYPQFMIVSDSSALAHPDVVGTISVHYRDP